MKTLQPADVTSHDQKRRRNVFSQVIKERKKKTNQDKFCHCTLLKILINHFYVEKKKCKKDVESTVTTWTIWRRSWARCASAPRRLRLWGPASACARPGRGLGWSGTTWNQEQSLRPSRPLAFPALPLGGVSHSLSALVSVGLRDGVSQPHLKLIAAQRRVSVVADEAVQGLKHQVVSQVEAGRARLLTWMYSAVLDSTWAPAQVSVNTKALFCSFVLYLNRNVASVDISALLVDKVLRLFVTRVTLVCGSVFTS